MSKQKRPPKRSPSERTGEAATDKSSGGPGRGNQAVQEQLAAREAVGRVDAEMVRAEVVPRLERAIDAMGLEPRSAERVAKFQEVLETSRLPADRKAVLIDRLITGQDVASAARSASERWFSGISRDVALEALGATLESVRTGEPGSLDGSIGEVADRWIGAVASSSHGEEVGEAVRGFASDVYLILAWFDEEEEEEAAESPPEVE